jgi:hypothetical protein
MEREFRVSREGDEETNVILVSEIPADETDADLYHVFESTRNRGGPIKDVIMIDDNTAVITFEETKGEAK